MVYEKVSSDMNFVDREKQVEKFWKDNDIFQKSIDNRKKGETYTFYDGPPTANGKPHIGHVLTRVINRSFVHCRSCRKAERCGMDPIAHFGHVASITS